MTIVQHRALSPDGKVLSIVTMEANGRWAPVFGAPPFQLDFEPAFETRILPDGEWEPSAVLRQPGRPLIVMMRGMY